MQDYRKLIVWQRAQELCVLIYQFSADFPKEETYGVTAQLRRAAVSVGSNTAEAAKRDSRRDKARVLNIAQGEAAEAGSLLDIVDRLGYGQGGRARELIQQYDEVGAMLQALRQRVRSQAQ